MALDGVVLIFYSWAGLLLMAVHFAIVAGVWAAIVKPSSSGVGWPPLFVGALGSALAVLLTSALLAVQQYSARSSALKSFWETVPYWTMSLVAIVGTASALCLTIVGVPAVAMWVRRGHRNGWSFAFLLLACSSVIIAFGFGLVVPSLLGFFTGAWLMVRGHPVAVFNSND